MKYLIILIFSLILIPQVSFAQSGVPAPAQGQRTIIAEEEPTIEQVVSPEPTQFTRQQIAYLVMALILLGLAGFYVSQLLMPKRIKENLSKEVDLS